MTRRAIGIVESFDMKLRPGREKLAEQALHLVSWNVHGVAAGPETGILTLGS